LNLLKEIKTKLFFFSKKQKKKKNGKRGYQNKNSGKQNAMYEFE